MNLLIKVSYIQLKRPKRGQTFRADILLSRFRPAPATRIISFVLPLAACDHIPILGNNRNLRSPPPALSRRDPLRSHPFLYRSKRPGPSRSPPSSLVIPSLVTHAPIPSAFASRTTSSSVAASESALASGFASRSHPAHW